MLADGPNWAEQVTAWSTLAAAVGAIGTLVGALVLLRKQGAVLSGQLRQLHEDSRDRGARIRREIQEQHKRRLSRARAVQVAWGDLNANDADRALVEAVGAAAAAAGLSPFPSRTLILDNRAEEPIHGVEAIVPDGSRPPAYVWLASERRLTPNSRLGLVPGGTSALFIWPQESAADSGYAAIEVSFIDAEGARWVTDGTHHFEGS